MKHIRIIITGLTLTLAVSLLAACDSAKEQETEAETDTATMLATESAEFTEVPTEAPTDLSSEELTEVPAEAPTDLPSEGLTEVPTDLPSEELTEAPTEEEETHRPTREDWDKYDPQNPYYNLIQVGTSFDGKTPVYDGRYEFDHVICHTSDGAEFYSMQDALDWLEGFGGNIQMDADPNICLKLDIPDDGCFYRIAYWWKNCDFVMDYGVIYDDQNKQDGIVGYAYYSDLYELDIIQGLENTYVWIIKDTYGLAPGYYRIVDNNDPDGELYYGYDLVALLEDWPGLPNGEILPD